MAQALGNRLDTVGSAGASTASLIPVATVRAPASSDIQGPNGPFKLGQLWVNSSTSQWYGLSSLASSNGSVTATWTSLGGAAGVLNELTTDDLTVVIPSAGNINLAGSANQIVTTGSGSTATFGLSATLVAPGSIVATTSIVAGTTIASGTTLTAGSSLSVTTSAAIGTTLLVSGAATLSSTLGVTGLSTLGALTSVGTAHINITGGATTVIGTGGTGAVQIGNATGNTAVTGSLTASTTLTATLGAITATNGNLVLGTAGNKILSTSVGTTTTAGANSFGSVTLVGGTATVATTAVTTNSLIYIWRQSVGATGAAALGQLSVGTISNGVSFIINAALTATATSLATTDVSVVGYMIVN